MKALVTFFLISGIIVSLRTRIKMMRWRSPHTKTQLSKAITQLVGTAGGIYISLEMLLTFLGIPEEIWNPSLYYVRPLAVLSIFIAILQPYGYKLWLSITEKGG